MEKRVMKPEMISAALGGMMALVCGSAAMAGQVNSANMTSFTTGTAALAAEVNGNFSEVTTQVNDNDSRIASLEAQMNALLGTGITAASMNGAYKYIIVSAGGQANTTGYVANTFGRAKGDLTFNGDGTCSVAETSFNEFEQLTVADSVDGIISSMTEDTALAPLSSCTYVITAGGKLTVNYPDGSSDIVHMNPGLQMGAGSSKETGTASNGATIKSAEFVVIVKKSQ